MDKILSNQQIYNLAQRAGWKYSCLKSIIQVESGQHGFDPLTGKPIIRPEKAWFQELDSDWRKETKNTTWQSNAVGNQRRNWIVFNSMFDCDPQAAMKATSIGLPQLMGFHFAECGFKSVGDFWTFMSQSEYNQIICMIKWVKTVRPLDTAIKFWNTNKIAYYYNGQDFMENNYPARLDAAERLVQPFTITS